jgi:hypothetical protein
VPTLTYTAGLIRRYRKQIGSPRRKLGCGRQALLVLAYLRKGETFAELAAGFGVSTGTAWRYVTETMAQRTPTAPRPGCAPPVNVLMPSSSPGAFCGSYAADPGAPGSWPRPSTSLQAGEIAG